MADSYYTVIKGKKYDRRMLELADGLTKGRGDGRISVNDAKTLLRVVKDSNSYSPTEKATMEYIRKRYKFTKEGDEYFRSEIRKWAGGKGKKKAPAKAKKAVEKPAAVAAETPAAAYEAPAYTAPAAPAAEKKSSPWKQILIALLLLALISAAFYFFAYRSSCAKPAGANVPVTEATPIPAPAADVAKAVPEAPAAKPMSPVSPELKSFVEKTRIIFIPEKSELTPGAVKTLDALAARLKGENLKLQLTGHACALGPKELNQQISEKRAQVVKDALVSRGVPAGLIETRGVGESETIGNQKTVAGRVASRRVTFKVLQ